jgi:hypothetical protein
MSLSDNLSRKADEAGAKTHADIGIFLVGAAAGGIVDATLNFFGFAEPMVVAGLTGAGALGLKKLLWDAPRGSRKTRTKPK